MSLPFSILSSNIIENIKGQYLESFLISYEGWRRGLQLSWYNEGTNKCTFNMSADFSGKFFSLKDENNLKYFYRTRGEDVSNAATSLTRDKDKTKELLNENNINVPLGKEFNIQDIEEILNYAENINYPVVLKPVVGYMGKGVFCDLKDSKELKEVYDHFINTYPYKKCIIEKQYYGEEHRIYVVGDEVVSAINRKPAHVIADGQKDVKSLIDEKNKMRANNPYLRDKPIKIDFDLKKNLKKSGYELDRVYVKGTKIELRKISNLARGGEPHDVTDSLSNNIKEQAVNAIKSIPNMSHGGVDIIVDSQDSNLGVVLEINATAEIVFHMYPISGTPQNIPGKLIDYYFPETKGTKLSNYYYEFTDIIRPLSNNFINKIEVSNAPDGNIYKCKYKLANQKMNFPFLKAIKSLAIKNNISGEITRLSDEKSELILTSTTKENINHFTEKFHKIYKNCQLNLMDETDNSQELVRLGFYINR